MKRCRTPSFAILARWTLFPVLVLSALDKDMDELRSYESGADEFVTKPFDKIGRAHV